MGRETLPENWDKYEKELDESIKDPILFQEYIGDILSKLG